MRSADPHFSDPADGDHRYRAPALEKGLDILELLAGEKRPMTLSAITQKLGRSTSELFRMSQVLERRGFIRQAATGDGMVLTDKLFSLGMDQPPVRSLIEVALPVMRELATETDQSCHLVSRLGNDIVVMARMESGAQIGFTVRIGHRRPLHASGSGAVLLAFQPDAIRAHWLAELSAVASEADIAAYLAVADGVRRAGYFCRPSSFVDGITDIAAPVLRGQVATASLVVPYVRTSAGTMPIDGARDRLLAAAARISEALVISDQRL
ncbi:MAG TPA: IclR family transcriptional regulator [Sphingomonas sp.]|jgi:DNA-binding IclR family transcriptional regulator|uniref:IclR family transcriptional regulator n=1 Tax=Sphingomonas sp. TaxID=28214 RepID=UPI002EDA02F4